MYEAIYIVDWFIFVLWSMYEDYKKTTHIEWLYKTISKPISERDVLFLEFRIESLYKLNHNSQVASIEEVLNDKFDATQKRIYITNSVILEPIWFYEEAASKPVYFYEENAIYFYEDDTIASADEDFIVHVPSDLQSTNTIENEQMELLMKSYIDYYKLFSKSYTILYE